ncbi:MAG: hypothetical protein R8J94_03645 [Acidimicrobiia bacterium]|nr:hypothetical protein [Acidimicrobiia bacterium]
MAFGQQSGPPATNKQLDELLNLLADAGYTDFKDARYPMDFTQRQAGGKFSRDEADAYIARLQLQAESGDQLSPGEPIAKAVRPSPAEQALQKFPADELAAELQRRGWIVAEP